MNEFRRVLRPRRGNATRPEARIDGSPSECIFPDGADIFESDNDDPELSPIFPNGVTIRKKKNSEVWQNITTITERSQATCDICRNHPPIPTEESNTSGLWKHLKLKRPEIYNKLAQDKRETNCTQRKSDKVKKFMSGDPKAKKYTRAIAKMIALDYQLYNVVAGDGFQGVLTAAEERYETSSATTFFPRIMPALHKEYKTTCVMLLRKILPMVSIGCFLFCNTDLIKLVFL